MWTAVQREGGRGVVTRLWTSQCQDGGERPERGQQGRALAGASGGCRPRAHLGFTPEASRWCENKCLLF